MQYEMHSYFSFSRFIFLQLVKIHKFITYAIKSAHNKKKTEHWPQKLFIVERN